jgi:23S rRNA (cytosine1962-C5)-methyltransferase
MPADFDMIILDPPAFAKNRASVDKAARGYKEINLQAMKKIKAGGILATFSCSQHMDRDLFQKVVFAAAADSGHNVRILQFLGQPADHPVDIFHPEGEYLKGLLLFVD